MWSQDVNFRLLRLEFEESDAFDRLENPSEANDDLIASLASRDLPSVKHTQTHAAPLATGLQVLQTKFVCDVVKHLEHILLSNDLPWTRTHQASPNLSISPAPLLRQLLYSPPSFGHAASSTALHEGGQFLRRLVISFGRCHRRCRPCCQTNHSGDRQKKKQPSAELRTCTITSLHRSCPIGPASFESAS